MRLVPASLLLLLLSACAGGGGSGGTAVQHKSAALVDDRPLVTAGPRCSGRVCRCREVDPNGATRGADDEGAPAEGQKRFELRTGRGGDDVQVTVEGRGTLHKSADSADVACGYIDLPPGEHRVRLRVQAPPGQGATPRLLIYERGEQTHSWYGTFATACGTGAVCTRAELDDRLAELRKPRGLFDPCGSVKVGGIHYDVAHDGEDRITTLDLEFTLKVYAFSPRFPHGGKCKGLSAE
jgi:hypothetical protein